MTLNKELKVIKVPGDALDLRVSNPLGAGQGFKIIGCRLGNTRSRGMLLKADNGIVRDNVVEGCGESGISVGPEYWSGEGDYSQNVLVEGNTVRGCGLGRHDQAAINIHGDGAMGNRSITIRANQLISNYGGDISLAWTQGASLSSNLLTAPEQWAAGDTPHAPLRLENTRDVALKGNVIRNASYYASPLMSIKGTVTNLTGNDETGVRTVP